jgi:hypothetical protein
VIGMPYLLDSSTWTFHSSSLLPSSRRSLSYPKSTR